MLMQLGLEVAGHVWKSARQMPRHWRIRYAGAKYHLTVRGNGREVILATSARPPSGSPRRSMLLARSDVTLDIATARRTA